VKKAIRGGKIDVKKLSEGGKVGRKNCLREIKFDQTVWGSQGKNMSEGVKNPVFCPRGVRKMPSFVLEGDKIPILSGGHRNFLSSRPRVLFTGIALKSMTPKLSLNEIFDPHILKNTR